MPEVLKYGAFRQDRMPGLPLKNYRGKTCFVNAVVQVLVHNPYVREQGKEHLGQFCQCKSCLTCYLGYCVHSAYGKTAQTELALPAWMLQHGFPKLAAGSGYKSALSPQRQVIILSVCQFLQVRPWASWSASGLGPSAACADLCILADTGGCS